MMETLLNNVRPKCQVPGCNKTAQNAGYERWRKASWVKEKFGVEEGYVCHAHHCTKYEIGGWEYKQFRKTYCENTDGRLGYICTATIINEGQLDADHINGDPSDNREENIQTLCANCHRVKTIQNKDYATTGRTRQQYEREYALV
jgi:5-methylcytosine-specific restriction endonuclease McrA